MYTCNAIEEASSMLESALVIGESPSLIVFDHADHPRDVNIAFSQKLHSAIPESWVIEIVPDSMPLPKPSESLYWIRRPLSEDEWRETLEQVLCRTATPQWASVEI